MKKILIIAYHYPPVKISSAVQRTLKFSKYLLDEHWQATVISINPIAAIATSKEQINEIPPEVSVKRSFALDTARHLSFKGKYFSWLALPDRWVSWVPFGVLSGLKSIIFNKPDIIFSTYPMASAHLIALILNRITNIPWVADFRDSMTETNYPPDPQQRKVFKWLESKVIKHCSKAIFTTEGSLKMYAKRYPDKPDETWQLLPNGYDEENFIKAEQLVTKTSDASSITLIHSGVIYPSERDPIPFLSAISSLKQQNLLSSIKLKIILRATAHDNYIAPIIKQLDIEDIVFLEPAISYEKALLEMLESDGLIILQASNCNHQIPAKVYEYFRAGKPILALTDPLGDTAKLLKKENQPYVYPLDNEDAIRKGIMRYIDDIINKSEYKPNPADAYKYNRKSRTQELAKIINSII